MNGGWMAGLVREKAELLRLCSDYDALMMYSGSLHILLLLLLPQKRQVYSKQQTNLVRKQGNGRLTRREGGGVEHVPSLLEYEMNSSHQNHATEQESYPLP